MSRKRVWVVEQSKVKIKKGKRKQWEPLSAFRTKSEASEELLFLVPPDCGPIYSYRIVAYRLDDGHSSTGKSKCGVIGPCRSGRRE